ncbi:hypothetical protein [Frigoribacterium sp. PhB24]|uniref:hypothetical protein n=1 Tax=Frigoribacterium sp. PhB24 TaxID=2485204 RepID=UPI000F47746B|nr:hypothetical protein [Frigoribacterium sp. PhB24]ROS48370.1 hypothetical protein EDF50_2862 [Frigoribacterium sp. PhB24]
MGTPPTAPPLPSGPPPIWTPPPAARPPRPRRPRLLVLPIVSAALVVAEVILPFRALVPMIYSYEGEAAAYGIHAVAVTFGASFLCWALAIAVIACASIALGRRHRLPGLSITAIVLAALVAFASPLVYLLAALSADAY